MSIYLNEPEWFSEAQSEEMINIIKGSGNNQQIDFYLKLFERFFYVFLFSHFFLFPKIFTYKITLTFNPNMGGLFRGPFKVGAVGGEV